MITTSLSSASSSSHSDPTKRRVYINVEGNTIKNNANHKTTGKERRRQKSSRRCEIDPRIASIIASMEQERELQPEKQKVLGLLRKIEASSSSSSSSHTSGDSGYGSIGAALKKAAVQGCSWVGGTITCDDDVIRFHNDDDDVTNDANTVNEKRRQQDDRWITIRSTLIDRDTTESLHQTGNLKGGYNRLSDSVIEHHVGMKQETRSSGSSSRDNGETHIERGQRRGRAVAKAIQANALHHQYSFDSKLDRVSGGAMIGGFHHQQQQWRQKRSPNFGRIISRTTVFKK